MTNTTTPELLVNVRELLRSPGARKHVHLRRPLSDLRTPVAVVDPATPVTVDADVDSVVEGLLVTGEVATSVRVSCVRCLGEATRELRVEVRELFATRPGATEEDGYAVLPGDLLPLDTMARDALVLAFPAAPLCRPDCAGLCPECGADRNATACRHEQPADPRWLPLAGLELAGDGDPDNRPPDQMTS